MLLQKAPQLRVAILRAADFQKQIRAVKTGQDVIRVFQPDEPNDVVADGLGRRRGKSAQARALPQCVQEQGDIQIAGAEILPPLADTVRLIHDDLRNIRVFCEIQKTVGHQPFRRDVDDAVDAASGVIQREHILSRRQRAVQICRADAVLQQRADLVAHQRDER